MIAGHMLEAFSKKCVKDATTILLANGDTLFDAKGSIIKQVAWRAFLAKRKKQMKTK
jgi:DNA topoisomerase-3